MLSPSSQPAPFLTRARRRPGARGALALALALAAPAGACTSGPAVSPPPPATQSPSPSISPRARERSLPRVENLSPGRYRFLVARAVRDLKAIGMWRSLAGDQYLIRIATIPGPERLPTDRHLADAAASSRFDEHGSGLLCDIRFYSEAMRLEREVVARAYALGLAPRPAPSVRVLWASVLAHELAHCRGIAGRGERFAEKVEQRARTRLERALTGEV